jgi:hypothetical protein
VDGEEMEEWIIICGGNGVDWMEEAEPVFVDLLWSPGIYS